MSTQVLEAPAATLGEAAVTYPVVVHRVDGFMTLHTAPLEAVRAALPSDALHPLRLPNGRALIAIAFYRKWAVTAGTGAGTVVLPPYGELPIMAVVSTRPLSRSASVLAMTGLRENGVGGFALAFPLTSREWRDATRSAMGLPTFVADFDLDLAGREWRLRVSEEGRQILAVRARAGGPLHTGRRSEAMFGTLDRRLVAAPTETTFAQQARPGGGTLELGRDHPVALALRALGVSPRAVATYVHHAGRAVLRAPAAIGRARPYPSHPGLETALGRYTVRYPGTPSIDVYTAGRWAS